MLSDLIHPLHLCFALGPVAVYLLLVGMLNVSSRPFVTTGARDAAALGIGIGGLVIVGPLQLLIPTATVFHWGPLVWLLLTIFYTLMLTLIVLLLRPRIVIYNMPADRIRPVLAGLVSELDNEARWAGACLVMPKLGVQLNVESVQSLRNVQLVSAGHQQSYEGWRRLEKALIVALKDTQGVRNPLGFSLVAGGIFLVTVMGFSLVQDAGAVAQSVQKLFQAEE
jgi:hypothetical protein